MGCGLDTWVGKIPWRRKWQPPPLFFPGQSHGQMSLVGYSPWGHKNSNTTQRLNKNVLNIFKLYNNTSPTLFHIAKLKLHSLNNSSFSPAPSHWWPPATNSYNCTTLNTLYKWNHVVSVFLRLIYFTHICSQGSSVLQHMTGFPSILRLN